ncbi:DUF7344 domain-containing protein [Natronosalvus caseinilyticus]|uniref:DUF7344 domain-containing protein n=1 Tax=Natronosalvus caseinilyticus TaxID=2953747 RepID=UPI003CCDD6CB
MINRTIEFDTVLDLCQSRRRRIVLALFADQQRSLTVNDLIKAIVKHDHHESITEVSAEVLTQIGIELKHAHIPRMEEAGVIEYNSKRKLAEPTDQFDQLQPYLSAIINADPALEFPIEL